MSWWGWALIIFFGIGTISLIYEKVTKRDLSEDIEEFFDD